MVITPMSSNSSLRSLERSSSVSRPSAGEQVDGALEQRAAGNGDREAVDGAHRTAPARHRRRELRGRRRRAREQGAGAALLAGERDVQAVDAEREADRGQAAAEAAEQLVVASAAADRGAEGGVVDLEHGAGVVADVAHEAEVEDHAARRRPARAARAPGAAR